MSVYDFSILCIISLCCLYSSVSSVVSEAVFCYCSSNIWVLIIYKRLPYSTLPSSYYCSYCCLVPFRELKLDILSNATSASSKMRLLSTKLFSNSIYLRFKPFSPRNCCCPLRALSVSKLSKNSRSSLVRILIEWAFFRRLSCLSKDLCLSTSSGLNLTTLS